MEYCGEFEAACGERLLCGKRLHAGLVLHLALEFELEGFDIFGAWLVAFLSWIESEAAVGVDSPGGADSVTEDDGTAKGGAGAFNFVQFYGYGTVAYQFSLCGDGFCSFGFCLLGFRFRLRSKLKVEIVHKEADFHIGHGDLELVYDESLYVSDLSSLGEDLCYLALLLCGE